MAHTITRSPRGVDAQVGWAIETTYGTQVTPATDFLPVAGDIGLVRREGKAESAARIPGRISRAASLDVLYDNGGEGSLPFELLRKGMLPLWRWAIGHNPTPAAQGGTTAYLTSFKKDLAAAAMTGTGTSLTIQTGVPMRGGTVEPFDFIGSVCPGWEVNCDAGGIATVSFNVDAQSAIHSTDLAAPSYPAEYVPLGWYSASAVKRAGTVLPGTRNVKITAENGLNTDAKLMDGTGKRARPHYASDASLTLTLEIEPSDLALTYDDWVAGTPRVWVVEFVGATIASTYAYTWRLTIPAGRITGDPPSGGGEDVVTHSLNIEAEDDGTNGLYTLEIIETASTI